MSRSETIARLPVPHPAFATGPRASAQASRPIAAAGFAAQALGQAGARRGLRAGAPLIAHAQGAYLSAQWTGPADRRLAPGALACAAA